MKTTPLRFLASVNESVLAEDTSPDFEFRYVDISQIDGNGKVFIPDEPTRFGAAPSRARRLAEPGSTVVSTVRTYLRAIATVPNVDDQLVFSTGFAVLRSLHGDPRYLSYVCRSDAFVDEVVARSVGVSYPAISPGDLMNIRVPSPDIEKQRRIADFLDDRITRIDQIITARQAQGSLFCAQEQAVLTAKLTRPFDATAPLRHLGVQVTTGPFGTVFSAHEYVDGGVPMINPTHIRDGRLAPDPRHSVSTETASRLTRHLLQTGDLVVSRKGDIGRTAMVTEDEHGWVCGSDSIALHATGSRVRPEFLDLVLKVDATRAQLLAQSNGATMPNLSEGNLLSLRVPALADEEQRSRVRAGLRVRQQHSTAQEQLNRSVQLLQEYKQSLITAAVTGELDVRPPAAAWLADRPH